MAAQNDDAELKAGRWGASRRRCPIMLIEGGMPHGLLSMDSFGFGLPIAALQEAA